jgi:hypothetical protein
MDLASDAMENRAHSAEPTAEAAIGCMRLLVPTWISMRLVPLRHQTVHQAESTKSPLER